VSHLYDRIGVGYAAVRREDPSIAAALHAALGDARTIVNVGAGTGSYEPRDRDVVAVEPSPAMLSQRPVGAAPAVQATAERLPFADGAFDAAMAILSDHHWPERAAGLRELRRVARRRAIVFQCELAAQVESFWLVRDYLTTFRPASMTIAELAEHLGARRIEPVPIRHDCRDGFLSAYWRRPTSTSAFATASRSSGCCLRRTSTTRSSVCARTSNLASGPAATPTSSNATRWISATGS
jgi:SAM-dependent methyltransferase